LSGPSPITANPKKGISFIVQPEGVVSSPIHSLKRREKQSFVILSASFLSFGESRHARDGTNIADVANPSFSIAGQPQARRLVRVEKTLITWKPPMPPGSS
jgi:hypothetical protein